MFRTLTKRNLTCLLKKERRLFRILVQNSPKVTKKVLVFRKVAWSCSLTKTLLKILKVAKKLPSRIWKGLRARIALLFEKDWLQIIKMAATMNMFYWELILSDFFFIASGCRRFRRFLDLLCKGRNVYTQTCKVVCREIILKDSRRRRRWKGSRVGRKGKRERDCAFLPPPLPPLFAPATQAKRWSRPLSNFKIILNFKVCLGGEVPCTFSVCIAWYQYEGCWENSRVM